MRLRLLPLIAGFVVAILAGPCFAEDTMTMQVSGQTRTFLLARPAASGPQPTIILLHGTGADGATIARRTGLDQTGTRQGFVMVFPSAINRVWNLFPNGEAESTVAERRGGEGGLGDDFGYIKALAADLVQRGISDPKQIYLAGISYGGLMTLRIACTAPEMFAGIGLIYSSMPEADSQNCRPSKPLPMVVINGTADPVLPYQGGPTAAGFSVWSTDRMLAFFRKLDGCSDSVEQSRLPHRSGPDGTSVVVERWNQCTRAPIMLYQIVGGGHGVQGSLEGDFDAYAALASFFLAQKTNTH
jgi:polyhydroxybutyrate depolymerase